VRPWSPTGVQKWTPGAITDRRKGGTSAGILPSLISLELSTPIKT